MMYSRENRAEGIVEAIVLIIIAIIGLYIAYLVYEAIGLEALFITILVLGILLAIIVFLLGR